MVQRKMRDEPPLQPPAMRRSSRRGRLANTSSAHQRHIFGFQLTELARQFEAVSLVAVRARYAKTEHFVRRKSWIEIQIDERYVHFRPVVVLAKRGTPVRIPKMSLCFVRAAVAQSVKRLVSLR